MQTTTFDSAMTVWYEPHELTPAQRKRKLQSILMRQSAMFTDRADLWQKPQRKRPAPPINQIPMFLESNPAYQPQ